MLTLDPLTLPLYGRLLIEASAGTGKTHTIGTLYLRLLLERRLPVEKILVVTFTQAATEELHRRIRQRVSEALEELERPATADTELILLLTQFADCKPPHPNAPQRLLMDALVSLDQAAIYTIHGFCQRMLQDHAFESGAAFEVDFITDESALRRRAVEDFWRKHLSPAAREEITWVWAQWKSPAALLKDLECTLALDDLLVLPAVITGQVSTAQLQLIDKYKCLRLACRIDRAAVADILQHSTAIDRRSYNKNIVAKALAILENFAQSDLASLPDSLPDGFDLLTTTQIIEKTKSGKTPPNHNLFDLCEEFKTEFLAFITLRRAAFLCTARTALQTDVAQSKQALNQLYYDDLLRQLDASLGKTGGVKLAERIRTRFPVALIDEFQDTDPQQYRIFHRVYPEGDLFLIGDPKQAIYAFRGADIFTYMRARNDPITQQHQYTLDTNWRSSARLVNAVNTLFSAASMPFIYASIPFYPVKPSVRATSLRIDGNEPSPLRFWWLPSDAIKCLNKETAELLAATACSNYVAELLTLASADRVTLGDRPLQPQDIAILTRKHQEGKLMQEALHQRGIGSVKFSQQSIFSTAEATDLSCVLEAWLALHDAGRVRTALATQLMGYSAAEIEYLNQNEAAWEAVLVRLQRYRDLWLEQDFMAAFQAWLVNENVGARLRRQLEGERCLTNLLQLGELLQVAALKHPGGDTLLRWLAEQRAEDARDETRQLRLESDAGLVKVLTMHTSKGLEYPIVLIPFPWSYIKPQKQAAVLFHNENGDTTLDLGSPQQQQHQQQADEECLAEGLRLLYVAITRAAHLCVLVWGKVNTAEYSPLTYLLHRKPQIELDSKTWKDLTPAQLKKDLEQLATQAHGCIEVEDLPVPNAARWSAPPIDPTQLQLAQFHGDIDKSWRITSYSALVRGETSERPDYDSIEIPDYNPPTVTPTFTDVFKLPAGAQTGHLLHAVLENLDFLQATPALIQMQAANWLARHGSLTSSGIHTDWIPLIGTWINQVLDTQLESGLCLRNIPQSAKLCEWEFRFAVTNLTPARLRATLQPFQSYQHCADGLEFAACAGLMRGFIDLVFQHQEKFYLVDYKSNRLGWLLEDYARPKLMQAIRGHRYDLQYLIYTLALHRFLARRVKNYNYAAHFGGVYYLFLRGMQPAHGSSYGIWADRPSEETVMALDKLF